MKHLKEHNETYSSHFKFAIKIGLALLLRGVIFIIHAFVPFIKIPVKLNLDATSNKMKFWCFYADFRKTKKNRE